MVRIDAVRIKRGKDVSAQVIPLSRNTPTPAPIVCANCGFPITGRFTRLTEGRFAHEHLAHCDQLEEAHSVAEFIADVADQHLTDRVAIVTDYRDGKRFWTVTFRDLEGQRRCYEQGADETAGMFLLRVTGGLVR